MAEVPVQNDAPVISESDLVSKVQIEPTTEKRPREEVFTRVRHPSASVSYTHLTLPTILLV